ncbi:MAG: hypothetical protein KJ017_05420 [Alphaproteobacteria bacterium]|nr:hypothetical protein [Alphaproteobacteria bacterium]
MKIYGLAVFAALVFLTGPAVAGDKDTKPYQCEVSATNQEKCSFCKTEEICANEDEALKALVEAKTVTAYTLVGLSPQDPIGAGYEEKIHGHPVIAHKIIEGVLAHDMARAFERSIVNQISLGACFQPRHALTVKTEKHSYDYLLCFECVGLAIYKDGQFIAKVGTHRDYSELNALMVSAGLPLSPDYAEEPEQKH